MELKSPRLRLLLDWRDGWPGQTLEFVQGLPRTGSALAYARRRHGGQLGRADAARFIEHPLQVASLPYHAGARDHVIAAGLLHDVLEKTDAVESDLPEPFGPQIADLVVAMTEDERIAGYVARKAALRAQVAAAGQRHPRWLPPTRSPRSASSTSSPPGRRPAP